MAPDKAFDADIHKAKGFGCVACHGGDATAPVWRPWILPRGSSASRSASRPPGLRPLPRRRRLHEAVQSVATRRQVAEYATSVQGAACASSGIPRSPVHGAVTRSRDPAALDPKSSVYPLRVADTCGGCHGDAKYMSEYKIPTDQLAKYKTSVHWKAMTVKGISRRRLQRLPRQSRRRPSGRQLGGQCLRQCHSVMADLFKKSVHAKAFAEMGNPGCVTCHENHGIQPPGDFMLGLGDKAVCSTCHEAADKGGKTAVEMRALIDSLSAQTDKAGAILLKADHAGMEVSQAQFDLNGAKDALVKARNAVHSFMVPPVKQEVEAGLAISAKVYARGVRAMEELRFRGSGSASSSW